MLKHVPVFQTKPSAAARLNKKFSTTAVSLRCFKASKVTLAFPPPSGSTANFVRLFIRSFVLTDNSWNGENENKRPHQMGVLCFCLSRLKLSKLERILNSYLHQSLIIIFLVFSSLYHEHSNVLVNFSHLKSFYENSEKHKLKHKKEDIRKPNKKYKCVMIKTFNHKMSFIDRH